MKNLAWRERVSPSFENITNVWNVGERGIQWKLLLQVHLNVHTTHNFFYAYLVVF